MKFDLMLNATPQRVNDSTDRAAAEGFDGGWVIETKHDPFLLINSAASRRTGMTLGTAVAVAFARSPMLLATMANDLQLQTEGRFILGLGTQIKPHIERRFSMPWGSPVKQMQEMILAIHAVWESWESGQALDFRGDYYNHTLMTPAFSPGPNPFGNPPIFVGALGPAMTELAGRYADGLVVHRFMTEKFLREVCLPRVRKGLATRAVPLRRPFELVYPPFVSAGENSKELAAAVSETRSQIAFYASTPAYRPVLDLHGWGKLGEQLHGLSKAQQWSEMADLISEDVLDAFSVQGSAVETRTALESRFGDVIDRVILYPPDAGHQH